MKIFNEHISLISFSVFYPISHFTAAAKREKMNGERFMSVEKLH
jgi:hypothetical protein